MIKKNLRAGSLLLSAAIFLAAPASGFAGTPDAEMVQFEAVTPAYEYDTDALVPQPESTESRFISEGGIYRNPEAEDTGEAVLMITGDLMCQYRQQQAAFISDGTDYPAYSDMATVIAEEKEACKQAHDAALQQFQPEIILPASEDQAGGALSSFSVPELNYGQVPQPQGEWDFDGSFQYAQTILKEGDLVIGNLETMISQSSPLSMQIRRLEDKPYLNSPAAFLDSVKYAGYDLLTLANNHNCDVGVRGLFETLDNLDRWNFMHTGMFADQEEDRYLLVDVNGIRIGIVSYATYFNTKEDNFSLEGQEILLNAFDKDKAKRDIRAARKAGAEYIIAFMHWGKENTHETTRKQERYASQIAEAGADYIVGSHPHALQHYDIIETEDGRQVPVIYSMGNFLSCMTNDVNNDTLILQLNLKKQDSGTVAVTSHRFYPCTILVDLEVTGEDGMRRTDSYVVTPHSQVYGPALGHSSFQSRLDLKYMTSSLDRIMSVYGNRLAFDLPYDPYGLEKQAASDENSFHLQQFIRSRVQWLAANRPV